MPATRAGRPFTADEVMTRFRAVTGDELKPDPVADLRNVGLGRFIVLNAGPLTKKYGDFRFIVRIDPGWPGPSGHPDNRGIFWEESVRELTRDQTPYWSATKYRGNVELTWFPPDSQRHTDDRWRELDLVLGSLKAR
jgi:hypothetical protein